MRVLQVNCVYQKGSTGKIVYDLHTVLQKIGVDSIVCYGRGDVVQAPNVYKTCGEGYSKLNHLWSRFSGIMYGGCVLSTRRLIRIIEEKKPDIVHLQCINGYFVNIYQIVKYLRDHGIRTVLTLHAEFMFTGGCGYALECTQWMESAGCGHPGCPCWRKETGSLFFDRTGAMWRRMRDAFQGFDALSVVSVSPWLMERAKQSAILGKKIHSTIFNGIDIQTFYPRDTVEKASAMGLQGKKILLHVTANFQADPNHIKGGYYILELARRLKGKNVVLLVAGPHVSIPDAPEELIFLDNVRDQKELATYYSMADLTVLTSERETFSMVTVESLCCGTPVVGFCAGGPESIALEAYSTFVPHGDLEALEAAVHIGLQKGKPPELPQQAASAYSRQRMIQDYMQCYEELLERGTIE